MGTQWCHVPLRNRRNQSGLAMVADIEDSRNLEDRRLVSRSELGITIPATRKTYNRQKGNFTCKTSHDVADRSLISGVEKLESETQTGTKSIDPTEEVRTIFLNLDNVNHRFLQARPKVCASTSDLLRISSKIRVTREDVSETQITLPTDRPESQMTNVIPPTSTVAEKTGNVNLIRKISNHTSVSGVTESVASSFTREPARSPCNEYIAGDFTNDVENDGTSSVDPIPDSIDNDASGCYANFYQTGRVSSIAMKSPVTASSSSVDPCGDVHAGRDFDGPLDASSEISLTSDSDISPEVYNTLESPFHPAFVRMLGQHEADVELEKEQKVVKTPEISELCRYMPQKGDCVAATVASSRRRVSTCNEEPSLASPVTFAEVMLLGVIHEKLARLDKDIRDCRKITCQTASDFVQLHRDSSAIAEKVKTIKKSVRKAINQIDKVTYLDELIEHLNRVNANMILKPFYVDIGAQETAV